jgi:hypothetical protein
VVRRLLRGDLWVGESLHREMLGRSGRGRPVRERSCQREVFLFFFLGGTGLTCMLSFFTARRAELVIYIRTT